MVRALFKVGTARMASGAATAVTARKARGTALDLIALRNTHYATRFYVSTREIFTR
jgi:hypothetical protein